MPELKNLYKEEVEIIRNLSFFLDKETEEELNIIRGYRERIRSEILVLEAKIIRPAENGSRPKERN